MNPNTAPDGRPQLHAREAHGASSPSSGEPGTVPRQQSGAATGEELDGAATDLLEHPDVHTAAEAAALENLLRCWVRETGLRAPERGPLRIPLTSQGSTLLVPVRYWSPSGWHRFGLPRVERTPVYGSDEEPAYGAGQAHNGAPGPAAVGHPQDRAPQTAPLDAVTLAGLLNGEGGPGGPGAGTARAVPGTDTVDNDLVERVRDSVRRTAVFVADRRRHPVDHPARFLAAEQSLLLGHPLHPTPKSREGLSEAETRLYSPELRGAFPLHWMAVADELLAADSAWTERGRTVPAGQLTARVAGPGLVLPAGTTALPLHPWQARDLVSRPGTAALVEAGLLTPLGPHGDPWSPTSSVRTVYRHDAPAMLKLSLGLRITNSRRENLRKELHRGVEVHRLLRTGLGAQWRAVHPYFDIVRDPAWLAVDGPDGEPVAGLDVMIRHNPFTPDTDATCVAGLVSPRPVPGPAGTDDRQPMRSRLAELVTRLAGLTGRPRGAVAAEWFLRYLERVVRPVIWLDGAAGIALEAHQQNTLVVLDPHGWPVGGHYRDNQGYYFRTSRRAELEERLPGLGEASDTFVADDVTDERFTYYLAINNVFGLIGAFGSQGLADERLLLAAFRGFLAEAATGRRALGSPLPALLLDTGVLRCKANLMTRLHGLDELVGPVDTQSVYVSMANPLHTG